ncbi:metallophosphoesterase family protein [Ferrovibrio sp.]|uniref:metallophosphoesterase family protein n=1 Tax=Ferrovibrio sp. TaxID=1917215 RepID=UPI003D12BFBF
MIHGLLSDAHGNVEAFKQAIALLRRFGAEQLHFLGDAVGYMPGLGVLDALIDAGIPAVMGNHEELLLGGEISSSRDAIYRLMQTRAILTEAQRQTVSAWPRQRRWLAPCGAVLLVHGSPASPTHGYVYPDSDLGDFHLAPGTTVFMGHTHRPFLREQAGVRYVNIGSCGLPRDAGSLGCVGLFDDTSGEVRLMRFDIRDATHAALRRLGEIHPAVRAVFERPTPDDIVGEVCDA